jgi:hypothetical protein
VLNKRLLIKNLLAHNDENSFYDKKRKLNFSDREGKAKFLKHICAMANSNPENNSYIVVGVEDEDNSIVGVDFFDDSKIQNLINAYLENPPQMTYENIMFPHLPDSKVVGLVMIRPNHGTVCSLRRNIWKYYGGSVFFREGSISLMRVFDIELEDFNSAAVREIEKHSQNSIKYTLDGVFDFMDKGRDFDPTYRVFKDYFVVCWAGRKREHKGETFYSRVNIELINEQVKLFYSDMDEISIYIDRNSFKILEYVHLGIYDESQYYPLEEVNILFKNSMSYEIESRVLFDPPKISTKNLANIEKTNDALLEKLKNKKGLNTLEEKKLLRLPGTYLLCHLNGNESVMEKLESAKPLLKSHSKDVYARYKESFRILRKVKYS